MKKKLYLIAIFAISLIGYAIANFAGYSPLVLLAAIILTPINVTAIAWYFSE